MRISAREACVKPYLRTRSDINELNEPRKSHDAIKLRSESIETDAYIFFFNTCTKTMCFQASKAGWMLLFSDRWESRKKNFPSREKKTLKVLPLTENIDTRGHVSTILSRRVDAIFALET